MKCPIDHTELVMSERHGVEIDYCPKCRGVWLDRGELDKIIDKASGPFVMEEPAPPPSPEPARRAEEPRMWREPYREPDRDERTHRDRNDWQERDRDYKKGRRYRDDWDDEDDDRRYRKRSKRKSILSEIFDILD